MNDEVKNLERVHLAKKLLESIERGIKAAMKPRQDQEPVLTKEQGEEIYDAFVMASIMEEKDAGTIAEA